MKHVQTSFRESEARLLLEAIQALDEKWLSICEASSDDDEVADYGNDLIELRLLSERLTEEWRSAFGNNVVNFSRDPL